MSEDQKTPQGESPPATSGGEAAAPSSRKQEDGGGALGQQVQQLTSQLEQAQARVKELEGTLGKTKSEVDTHAAANADLHKKLTEAAGQVTSLTGELDELKKSGINSQTQLTTLTEQLNTVQQERAQLAKRAQLFETIAGTPEFHPLVGSFNDLAKVVNPDASPEDVSKFLNTVSGQTRQQVEQAVNVFRAGGTPTSGTTSGGTTAHEPTTAEAAFQAYQQALQQGDNASMQKYFTQYMALQNGASQQQN